MSGSESSSHLFTPTLDPAPYLARLAKAEPVTEFGIVQKSVANTIESHGPNVPVGSLCWLERGEIRVPLEVVGFMDGKVVSMPLAQADGVRRGDIVRAAGR